LLEVEATNVEKAYQKVIAEKFIYEKKQIVKTFQKYGIHSVLTKPRELNVNLINKYLELKARRLI
jgi:alpha-glucuronidase